MKVEKAFEKILNELQDIRVEVEKSTAEKSEEIMTDLIHITRLVRNLNVNIKQKLK